MAKTPIIRISDLRHSFSEGEGTKEVLHGISLEFMPGEIAIIRGPSGSGKTTLLKLIGGLRTIQSGSIEVDGMAVEKARRNQLVELRRQIGFIFQSHQLISSLNALRNVMMPLAFVPGITIARARQQAADMLKRVGLQEHAHKFPEQLSGGQKQRVAVARALVHEPRLVLADEPTASLDGKTGREIVSYLEGLARQLDATILLVTHDDRIIDVADRVVDLEDGRVGGG